MRSWIVVPAFAGLAVLSACGGGGSEGNTQRDTSPVAGGLCGLLPNSSVAAAAGYHVTLAQEHSGPGTLHFCTIFLAATGCSESALSLEDLGSIDANANNDSDSYRATLIAANPDAQPSFQ